MGVERKLVYVEDEADECKIELTPDDSYVQPIKVQAPLLIGKIENLKDQLTIRLDKCEDEKINPKEDQVVKEIIATIDHIKLQVAEDQKGRGKDLIIVPPSDVYDMKQEEDADREEQVMSITAFKKQNVKSKADMFMKDG